MRDSLHTLAFNAEALSTLVPSATRFKMSFRRPLADHVTKRNGGPGEEKLPCLHSLVNAMRMCEMSQMAESWMVTDSSPVVFIAHTAELYLSCMKTTGDELGMVKRLLLSMV